MSDNIIKLNQELIHTELKDLVKNSVEETLNAMLDAEADRLVNAERYARDEDRKGYRAGHYDRSFSTTAGDVNLKMPKLKGVTFETAIIERYRRRETSVEEALIEMYLAGVSVRRVEDITEALWVFPNAKYQRCIVHFYRNVFSVTPNRRKKEVAKMLKAIHAQEDKTAAREKAKQSR